jgi:aspartokinase
MTPSARLGGFKILKDVVRISPIYPNPEIHSTCRLCQALAEEKINLPFITCLYDCHSWGFHIMLEASDAMRASHVIKESFGRIFFDNSKSFILSIFPHKRDPEITSLLFETFDSGGLEPDVLANSPSAISIVLKEEYLSKVDQALFSPFSFSAYRTPADWKLAQKGKEKLYKEVVASYQEQRPKVYGLEVHENQAFIRVKYIKGHLSQLGPLFKEFARLGLNLTFIATCPGEREEKGLLAFCVPAPESESGTHIIGKIVPGLDVDSVSPVSVFSMNGPHFGDRYGIAKELLTAFMQENIDFLGLSCTIASITGIVSSHHLESATNAIQTCFEVPSITKKA